MSAHPSIVPTTCSTPSLSSSLVSIPSVNDEFSFATSADRRDVAAKTLQYQRLERALDLSAYQKQVEQLLSKPIKIPATQSHSLNQKKTFFPVRGIWPTDEKRKEKISKFYSFGNIKGREWIRDLLLDESDSEEDANLEISHKELQAMLKNHKLQRDLRLQSKGEAMNSSYAYYSVGLISVHDSYNDGSKSRNKPVEVNASALSQLAAHAASTARSTPPPLVPTPQPDDAPEPLSVDANFSTMIPLPPLSH